MQTIRKGKILNRIRDIRQENMSDPRWGIRMSGEGEIANTIDQPFKLSYEKFGLNNKRLDVSNEHFRENMNGQIEIFFAENLIKLDS